MGTYDGSSGVKGREGRCEQPFVSTREFYEKWSRRQRRRRRRRWNKGESYTRRTDGKYKIIVINLF